MHAAITLLAFWRLQCTMSCIIKPVEFINATGLRCSQTNICTYTYICTYIYLYRHKFLDVSKNTCALLIRCLFIIELGIIQKWMRTYPVSRKLVICQYWIPEISMHSFACPPHPGGIWTRTRVPFERFCTDLRIKWNWGTGLRQQMTVYVLNVEQT